MGNRGSKRDTTATAESVLRAVVESLETDMSPRGQLAVMAELVSHGPFVCPGGLTNAVLTPAHNAATCTELRRFLRAIVRGRDSGQFEGHLSTAVAEPVTFRALSERGRVRIAAAGHVRDQVVLQLVLLIDQVGLSQLLPCPGPHCEHIFVKTHRAKFCSKTCQRRDEVRRRRGRARAERERRNAEAVRRKRLHVVRRGA